MIAISALILATAIVLSGCNYQDENNKYNSSENDPVINSNCPVYINENKLYFIQQNDSEESYGVMCENDMGEQKLIVSSEGFIKDLFVKDGNLYYSAFDQDDKAHIFMYNLKDENKTELFDVPSDHLSRSFIYGVDDNIYYYGKGTLSFYKNNEYRVIISDADSCLITNEDIYYSKGNNIYFLDNETHRSECIVSEQSIYTSGVGTGIINSSGEKTAVENIESCGDDLFFALCDANFRDQASMILKWSKTDKRIESVCDNFVMYNNFIVSKGLVYACGKDISSRTKGIFKIDKTGKTELVVDEIPINGFYVFNDTIYYYLSKETDSLCLKRENVNGL